MAEVLDLLKSRKQFGRGLLRPLTNDEGIVKRAVMTSVATEAPTFDDRLLKATALISTPDEDRSEDVLPPRVIKLADHQANPVVFFDHGMDLTIPIAKSEDADGNYTLRVADKGIEADSFFDQDVRESAQIYSLVKSGILRAASVHIGEIEAEQRSRGSGNRPGLLIKSCSLYEWSWVGIPDNPKAVKRYRDDVRKTLSLGKIESVQGLEPICESIKKGLMRLVPDAKAPVVVKGYRFDPVPAEMLKMADEEPADDAMPAEEPLGAQVIAGLHSAVKSLSEQLTAAMAMVENEKVVAGLKDLSKSLADLLATCEGLHQEAYPKSAAITGDEPEDQQAIETGAKALVRLGAGSRYRTKGILYRAEQLALAKNLLPTQRHTVETISELLAEALARASEPVVDVTKAVKPDPLAEALATAGPSLAAFAADMRAIREAIEDARPQG